MITNIGTIELSEDNKNWYNRKGYTMTGETLTEETTDISGATSVTEWVVFKGTWTRYMSVRDCGDHYIIARYSRYDRINKNDLSIIKDVEDI